MGSKYQFKPDSNPGVGSYNLDSGLNMSKASVSSAVIHPESARRKQQETSPPISYDNNDNMYDFNKNIKPNVYVNSKYTNKYLDTPPPNKYNPNDKVLSTRQRSPDVIIKESVMEMYEEKYIPPVASK